VGKPDIFPLPLTCFEEYMLGEDRPAYPMSCVFRARFSGFLDRGAFEATLADAVRRHPLLRATVDRTRRRPAWIDHPDWQPEVCWQAKVHEHGFPQAGYIDLAQEPGTRIWVVDRDAGHDLIVQAHHCATDALGMSSVFDDLLIGYALKQGAPADVAALPELDERRLLDRGTPGVTTETFLKMVHKQAVGLLGVREFLLRRPVPLTGKMCRLDDPSAPPPFPAPRTHEFTPDETRQIVARAKSLSVTLNDLLVRDLFLVLGAWREENGYGAERDWLRMSIPVGLRTAAETQMPMANSVSMVFLDRRQTDLCDGQHLLDGIRRQMQRIKRNRLQYTFILSLALSRLTPGGLSNRAPDVRCRSTSCFSNLGIALGRTPLPREDGRIRSGNVVLDSVDYVIPLRPHLHAAFCVYTYAGRLRLLMHFDPRAIPAPQAENLLHRFVEQIR